MIMSLFLSATDSLEESKTLVFHYHFTNSMPWNYQMHVQHISSPHMALYYDIMRPFKENPSTEMRNL
jgi:hypothetical protein